MFSFPVVGGLVSESNIDPLPLSGIGLLAAIGSILLGCLLYKLTVSYKSGIYEFERPVAYNIYGWLNTFFNLPYTCGCAVLIDLKDYSWALLLLVAPIFLTVEFITGLICLQISPKKWVIYFIDAIRDFN